MQEILLMGNSERVQDKNNVKFVNAQLLYATVEYEPVLFVNVQLLYAVQEEIV